MREVRTAKMIPVGKLEGRKFGDSESHQRKIKKKVAKQEKELFESAKSDGLLMKTMNSGSY